jgi:hypothetical protein
VLGQYFLHGGACLSGPMEGKENGESMKSALCLTEGILQSHVAHLAAGESK